MILITSRREVIGAKTFCSTCISYSASSLASNACTLPAFCITSLSWQKITISNKDVINLYNIHYWPSMRPRWLDIGQVFLASLWPETKSRSIKMQKKKWRLYEAFLAEPAFKLWIYYMAEKRTFLWDQACALAEPDGPWLPTLALRWLANLNFPYKSYAGHLDFTGSEHWIHI